jgi:presenilin-like A22 family membrane protease
MKLTDQQRRKHVYYSYQIMLMALAFFFGTLILIKLFQEEAKRFISTLKVNKNMANFLFNLSMIIFVIIFNLLSLSIGMLAFIAMMVIGKTYEDMVYIGKENYKGRSSYD